MHGAVALGALNGSQTSCASTSTHGAQSMKVCCRSLSGGGLLVTGRRHLLDCHFGRNTGGFGRSVFQVDEIGGGDLFRGWLFMGGFCRGLATESKRASFAAIYSRCYPRPGPENSASETACPYHVTRADRLLYRLSSPLFVVSAL